MVKEIEHIEEKAFKIFKSLGELSAIAPGFGIKKSVRKRLGNYAHYSLFNLLSVSLGLYSPQFAKIYYIGTKIFGTTYLKALKKINLLSFLKDPETAKIAGRFIPLLIKFFINKKTIDSKEFLKELDYRFSFVGTGNLVEIDVKDKNIKLVLKDSYSTGFPNIHKKACIWCGIFIGLSGDEDINNYDIVETKCVANGDKYCEFWIYENRYGKLPTFKPFTEKETDKIIKALMENMMKGKRIRKKIGDEGALFALQFLNYLFVEFYKFQPIILYRGSYIGKRAAQIVYKKGESVEELSKLFLKGKYGILSYSKNKDSIKIRIEECALCSGCENIHEKICGFFSGFIRGWLEETTKFSWDVFETKCIANGDDYCEFECKKSKM